MPGDAEVLRGIGLPPPFQTFPEITVRLGGCGRRRFAASGIVDHRDLLCQHQAAGQHQQADPGSRAGQPGTQRSHRPVRPRENQAVSHLKVLAMFLGVLRTDTPPQRSSRSLP